MDLTEYEDIFNGHIYIAKKCTLDLIKKPEPFPVGTVDVRFSDWKLPRKGSFQWTEHGFYIFLYNKRGKNRQRQTSPGYEPVEIMQDGKKWSVYLNDPDEK